MSTISADSRVTHSAMLCSDHTALASSEPMEVDDMDVLRAEVAVLSDLIDMTKSDDRLAALSLKTRTAWAVVQCGLDALEQVSARG